MSSKRKRLKRTVLAIPPAAPATVAVVPVGAPPLGRQARRRGVGAIAETGIESAVAAETGTGIGGETVGAEVENASVIAVAAAEAGTVGIVVSHEVGTGVVRTEYAIGVLHLPLGPGMARVRVLTSERRAQSGSQWIT